MAAFHKEGAVADVLAGEARERSAGRDLPSAPTRARREIGWTASGAPSFYTPSTALILVATGDPTGIDPT